MGQKFCRAVSVLWEQYIRVSIYFQDFVHFVSIGRHTLKQQLGINPGSTAMSLVKWRTPPASVLNFSNCTFAASFYAANFEGDIPYSATNDFLLNGLEGYLFNKSMEHPSFDELLSWAAKNSYVGQLMWNYTMTNCRGELCPKLRWQGNSDITGPGVWHHTHA